MKNVGIFLVVGIIIISGFAVAMPRSSRQQTSQNPAGDTFQDELDQAQTSPQGPPLSIGAVLLNATHQVNLSAAQSFIPRKDVVTRALLLMARNATTTHNCTCDLRDNLTGTTLETVQVAPDQFKVYDPTNTTGNLTWVEFDFYSVWITPGSTYYLVVYTANVTNNVYYCAGNGSNPYKDGAAYYSLDNGQTWQNLTDGDACFQTYGAQETNLSVTASKGLFGPMFTIRNTGNHTAGGVTSNVTVTGGILGLIHLFTYNYYEDLPQNNQKYIHTPIPFGFGPVTITETVSGVNVKEQVVRVNATVIIFIM
ncbi:MAG TPA: hypothetical protein VMT57_07720, partial [Candidatus Thermoplasmatota archaeon]|nr:hypothetical protein [Candidatus Thermoplasmatota archaeon]